MKPSYDDTSAALEPRTALEEMLAAPALESTLAATLRPAGATESLIGEIVDTEHPALRGRVRVRWRDLEEQTFEQWLPTLQALPVRVSDRVMMVRPSNFREFVVTGVLDGFARRPEPARSAAAAIEVKRDQVIRIRNQAGEGLVEIYEDPSGTVVRLLDDDVDLDLRGKLRIKAKSIELVAKEGPAHISASDDVVVRGEAIHLN